MFNKINFIFVSSILVSLIFLSCSHSKYGVIYIDSLDEKQLSFLEGKTQSSIFNTFGAPDITLESEKSEFWVYRIRSSVYFFFIGRGKEKDLIIEFINKKVVSNRMLNRGFSVGFLFDWQ
ncbi:MAG: hypothetical protein GY870_18000 [archaeon]|nr:hypothetical protein [archaeon]